MPFNFARAERGDPSLASAGFVIRHAGTDL